MSDSYDTPEVSLPQPVLRTKRRHSLKPAIAVAILKTQAEVETLTKTKWNDQDRFAFVTVDDYYKDVVPVARNNGLFWNCHLSNRRAENIDGSLIAFDVSVELRFRDGTCYPDYSTFEITHPNIGAQTTASVMSYCDKIFMRTVFKVPTQEGDADFYGGRGGPDSRRSRPTTVPARPSAPPPAPPPDDGYYDTFSAGDGESGFEDNEQRVTRLVRDGQRNTEEQQRLRARAALESQMIAAAREAISLDAMMRAWQDRRAETSLLEVGSAEDRAAYQRIKQRYIDRKAELLVHAAPPAPSRRQPAPFRSAAGQVNGHGRYA